MTPYRLATRMDGKTHFVINTFGPASLSYGGTVMIKTDELTPIGQELATPDLRFSVKSMLGGLLDIARTQIWFDVVVRNNGQRVCTIMARSGEFEIDKNYIARADVVEQKFITSNPSVTFGEFLLDLHASKTVRRIDIKYGKNAWVSVFIHKASVFQVRPNGNHFARALNDIVVASKGIPDIGLDEQPAPIMALRHDKPASASRSSVGTSGPMVLSPSGGAIRKVGKAINTSNEVAPKSGEVALKETATSVVSKIDANREVVEQPEEVVLESGIKELVKPKLIVVTKTDAGRTAAVASGKGTKKIDAKKDKEKKKCDTYRQLLQIVESLAATLKMESEPEDEGNGSGDED